MNDNIEVPAVQTQSYVEYVHMYSIWLKENLKREGQIFNLSLSHSLF